ncbi:hypothetical protein PC129_g21536 [Phytophthora cactorum]|uniref:Uncharacterized protein n=1 Tax=Phytophthora cactorum TaxID=29920 RepID=A0A329SAY7_9STRA|nr:hypothetical protein Pcac1_g3340 [Phytophthora cactorum]KAG3156473.1 hypothetical protein PI126_g8744 [Phytophthora idaei]KAG2796270.1 hypothetical protein PC111_g21794 [Phytophthora cactorum]KAG2796560.1 hypothetical protein PC112_g22156 [Phytophthora cactorum]KAG2845894.1 hypothetical protein PC113_g18088 [Phytophthora cactorum]
MTPTLTLDESEEPLPPVIVPSEGILLALTVELLPTPFVVDPPELE